MGGILSGWIQIDPALEQIAVEVGDQGTNVATLKVPIPTRFQIGLNAWAEVIEVPFVAGLDFSVVWKAQLSVREKKFPKRWFVGEGIHAMSGGQYQDG